MSHFNFNFKRNWERSKLCSQISSQKKGKQFFPLQSQRPDYSFFAFSFPLLFPLPPFIIIKSDPFDTLLRRTRECFKFTVNHGAKANSPEQTVRRARLDLSISVTRRRAGRWLRLAGRSLDQSRGSTTFRQPDRGRAGHHLDARALPRRVERLLEQRQDQPDVLPHRVLQRGHLPGQLVYSRVYLFHGSARSTLKVT